MGDIAVRVENLGKMYRIGGSQERYRTFRDSIADAVSAPFRRAWSLLSGQAYGAAGLEEEIWALKNVSFEVKHGEVVGIIGRNGAGKSTLLKILSRITEPTEGCVDVYGRVGALLEVGTGFHPELTGRENVYLNGAILGMSRAEINRKFDEIVDFAGVERFIDTPVKHYSSGMGLRLGFSVAAHLEPEILVVDEVLAVGDAEFQKKCLGKMSDVAGEGRTVLFVSHNMGAVEHLCESAIYLVDGQIRIFNDTSHVVGLYLRDVAGVASISLTERTDRKGTGVLKVTDVSVLTENNQPLQTGKPAVVKLRYCVPSGKRLENVTVALGIDTPTNTRLFTAWSKFTNDQFECIDPAGEFLCTIPKLNLREGNYLIHTYVSVNNEVADLIENAFGFEVQHGRFFPSGVSPSGDQGYFLVEHKWHYVPKNTNQE